MPLFKYLPPSRFGILGTLKIRFTPGDAFNDPFEITPSAVFMDDPAYFARFVAQTSKTAAKMDLSNGKIGAAQVPARTVEVAAAIRAGYKHSPTGIKGVVLDAMRKRFVEYRVLCLSKVLPTSPDSILLWAHYTEGHKGFVLELDEKHEWIKAHRSSGCLLRDLGSVRYLKGRVKMKGAGKNVDRRCYLAKSSHWKYEQEMRLVRAHNDPELDLGSLGRFPPSLVKSVTVGANRSQKNFAKVLRQLAKPALRHVILYQGALHVEKFEVTRTVIKVPGRD